MSDRPIAGFECVMAYKNGSNWVAMPNVANLQKPKSWEEILAAARNSPSKRYIPGQDDLALDFDYLYIRGTDAVFDALIAAADGRLDIELLVADGPVGTSLTTASGGLAGVAYMRDWFHLFKADEGQELNGAVTYAFTAKPAPHYVSGSLVERSYGVIS